LVTVGKKPLGSKRCSLASPQFLSGAREHSCHAEVNALKLVPYGKLKDRRYCAKIVLYVARFEIHREGLVLRDSMPCSHCLRVLYNYGIKSVVYSVSGFDHLVSAKVNDILASGLHGTSSAQKLDEKRSRESGVVLIQVFFRVPFRQKVILKKLQNQI